MEILPFVAERDLEQLTYLINGHIGVLIPGWALPAEFIAQRLQRDPAEYVTDPWLDKRKTLVGYSNGRLCAAIHLERYSPESPPGATWYIKWFVFWPDHQDLGLALLETACSNFKRHGMQQVRLSQNLYTPGVPSRSPDCWPHISAVMALQGFSILDPEDVEYVNGGLIPDAFTDGKPNIDNLQLVRRMGRFGTLFEAVVGSQTVASVECVTDTTLGGRLPALTGWAELAEVDTEEAWRNKGIGTWLVGQVNQWLRMGGFTRLIVCVAKEDHDRGAGRFYQRFGWEPFFKTQGNYVLDLTLDGNLSE